MTEKIECKACGMNVLKSAMKAHSTSARCRGRIGEKLLQEEIDAGMVKSLPAAWMLQTVGAPVSWQPADYEAVDRTGGRNGGPHRGWKMWFTAAVPAWATRAVGISTRVLNSSNEFKPIALGTIEAIRQVVENDDYYEAFEAALDTGAATVMMLLQAEETRQVPTPFICEVRKDAEKRRRSWAVEYKSSVTWKGEFWMPAEVHDQVIMKKISEAITSKLSSTECWIPSSRTIEIRTTRHYTGKTPSKLPTDQAILDEIDPVGTLMTVATALDEVIQGQGLKSEKDKLAERIQTAESLRAALPGLKPQILAAMRGLPIENLSARALAEILRNALDNAIADGKTIANAIRKVQ